MCFRKDYFILSLLMLCIPVVVYAGDTDQAQDPVQISDAMSDSDASSDLSSQEDSTDSGRSGDDFCDADCIESTVENYNSLIVSGLVFDSLLYGGGRPKTSDREARLPVYTFNFSNLFRFNVHYLHAIRIAGSRFAFCFGGGYRTVMYAFPRLDEGRLRKPLGTRRASLHTNSGDFVTLGGNPKDDACVLGSMNARDGRIGCSVKSSILALKYMDFLLRLRFNTNLESPKSGFFTWVGFKVGYLLGFKSVIKYEEMDHLRRSRILVRRGDFGGIHNAVSCLGELGLGYARVGVGVSCDIISLFKSPRSGGFGSRDLLSRYGLSVGLMVDLI